MTGFVQEMQGWRAVMAGIAVFATLVGRAVPASALPLKLFPSPVPEACAHQHLVFGPSDSMWFLLSGCEVNLGGKELSGIGRLPINDPKPQLFRRLKAPPNDLTVGPEGDLWFTEGPPSEGGSPGIGRLTAARSAHPVPELRCSPNLPYKVHEQVEQIVAGPENDLWFIAEGFGGNVLSRITPKGALSQFPAQQVLNGRHELESKGDEVPRALAKAADGNLWMGEYFEAGTIGLVEAPVES